MGNWDFDGNLEYITPDPGNTCEHEGCGETHTTECAIDWEVGDDGEWTGKDAEWLCYDHAKDAGYCFGCGHFWAGATSFDFSRIEGYCENCVAEIQSTSGNYGGDDEDYIDYEDAYYP